MKRYYKIFILIVCSLFIVACQSKSINEDALRFKEEYESYNGKKNANGKEYRTLEISDDNKVIYSSLEDVIKRINKKETLVIYFGFSTCPWCRSILPFMLESSQDYDVNIHYVDIESVRDVLEVDEKGRVRTTVQGMASYFELLELLNEVLDDYIIDDNGKEYDTMEKRIYAPNVIMIKDGVPTQKITGIPDDFSDPYGEISADIQKEMRQIFNAIFAKIGSTTCKEKGC